MKAYVPRFYILLPAEPTVVGTVRPPLLAGEGEYEIQGDIQRGHGPRFSEKPVFHRKPIDVTEFGYCTSSDGELMRPSILDPVAYSRNYMAFDCCTIIFACYTSGTGNNWRVNLAIEPHWAFFQDGTWKRRTLQKVIWGNKKGQAGGSLVSSYLPIATLTSAIRNVCVSMATTGSDIVAIYNAIYPFIPVLAQLFRSYGEEVHQSGGSVISWKSDITPYNPLPPDDVLRDLDRWQGAPLVDYSNYYVAGAKQQAFLAACDSVPRMSDNAISNALELFSFIKDLVLNHKVSIPHSLSEAWLAYRYQYKTTELDVKEAIAFMDRNVDQFLSTSGLKVYGTSRFSFRNVDVTLRCTLNLKQKELSGLRKLWVELTKYGFAPDAYVIWDMIPFSFIVDWFFPVQDALQVMDASRLYNSETYDFGDIVYSTSYDSRSREGVLWHTYRRWIEESPPDLSGYYWLEQKKPSARTVGFRALDAASLLLG